MRTILTVLAVLTATAALADYDRDCPSAKEIAQAVAEACPSAPACPPPACPAVCPEIVWPEYEMCLREGDNRPDVCPQPKHRRRVLRPIIPKP